MNIFVVPSWYPSKDHPINGSFIYEQLVMFCGIYPHVKVGVSLWGQKNESNLLYVKDHLKNIKKLVSANMAEYKTSVLPNLVEYHKPTFTWTRKINKGNIQNIVRACVTNLKRFESDFGNVDVIHAHCGYPGGYIAMEISKQLAIPYIITEHLGLFPSSLVTDKRGCILPLYLKPYLFSEANIAVSPFHATELEKASIPKVQVIANFIDESSFKLAEPQDKNGQEFLFFTLSKIASSKGTDQLLYAIKNVVQQKKHVKFKIGGDGPHSDSFKRLASFLKIEKHVEWLGEIPRDQAVAEFQKCDAFVLPSIYESMGIVYIEALACGKPIIATKCGGPESTVTQFNGLLVDKNNVEELSKAMLYLLDNYGRFNTQQIRNDFLERFSSNAVVPKLYELYSKISSSSLEHTP
ncbi:glycosyltransferase [Pontibacter silvestris]|uniref:Glycosyltransferase n=1 Tax=Pontibacter silvestris TaxID=2305183 RepID=A0ABW4X434_9BACT|nr:glycosyltransferase [Pontibacter silvestris]MCC9137106.1 glycosyltransferase [Pontibacter silvestris]